MGVSDIVVNRKKGWDYTKYQVDLVHVGLEFDPIFILNSSVI